MAGQAPVLSRTTNGPGPLMLKFKGSCKGDKTTKSLTRKKTGMLKLLPLPTDETDAEEVKLKFKPC